MRILKEMGNAKAGYRWISGIFIFHSRFGSHNNGGNPPKTPFMPMIELIAKKLP